MDTDNYEIPEFPASKTIQKQQKYVLSMPGWLQPSSNGKQDLKFITQEYSVQQQGKCWCRPNIFSAYCKFYFRVITLVISDCAWEQHEANPAFWLANQVAIKGLLFFVSVFMDLNFVWAKKCKKEYDQYPAIMTSHHIYLLKERKRNVVYFFLTMFHLRCSICQCHHRKIPFFQ